MYRSDRKEKETIGGERVTPGSLVPQKPWEEALKILYRMMLMEQDKENY